MLLAFLVVCATAAAVAAALAGLFVSPTRKSTAVGAAVASAAEPKAPASSKSLVAADPERNLGTSLASPSPILRLYADLAAAFANERAAGHRLGIGQAPESFERLNATVRGLTSSYMASGVTDWKQYVLFNDDHYLRHLVDMNDDFEMLVLCWKRGQGSRVHNHADSHGWVNVLQGPIEEVRVKPLDCRGLVPRKATNPAAPPPIPGVLAAAPPCPDLEHVQTGRLQAGGIAYINDTIALHAVRCPPDCEGEGAVTLHVYSPPVKRVYLFEPDENRVVYRVPGFYSMRGQIAQQRA